jgi:hypothetical protein
MVGNLAPLMVGIKRTSTLQLNLPLGYR